MSNFKAKMHQIQFRLGVRPRPCWGAYSAAPDPQLDIRGLFLRGEAGKGGSGERREGRGPLYFSICANACDRRCGGDVSGANVEGDNCCT